MYKKIYKYGIDFKVYQSYNTVEKCIIKIIQSGCDVLVSFDSFSPEGLLPIYMQIVLFIKRGIVAENIKNGDELPSRRYLSALLGVNPNTVQKAYRILEEEGLIFSQTGAKSTVDVTAEDTDKLKAELLRSDMKNIIRSVKQTGLSLSEAIALIKENWDEVK